MHDGGKADALIKLQRAGFNVPKFFVCKISDAEKDILGKIGKSLPNVQYFAVRSSAKNEDSKKESRAGYYYSAIGVPLKDVFKEFLKVTDSFRDEDGFVIIQEFVPSDKAGVIFSQVGNNNIVINSTAGLCQPVVNDYVCDEYVCDKNGKVVYKNIPKEKELRLFKDSKIVSGKASTESLGLPEIEKLASISREIQDFFGIPQDIEWCFKNSDLYILQSRPITRDFKAIKEEYFFDSANIAESYSGIVLPLTYSYAQFIYEKAYTDLLVMSGVSKKKIENYKYIFENLLGYFYGRMYYNMNNWYRMTAFVPGYRRNKQNLESMITSNVKEEIDTSIKPSLWLKVFYPLIVSVKILLFGFTSRYFRTTVREKIRSLQKHNFDNLNYQECVSLFAELNKELLHKWYITLENDFFVMTYLGFLRKIVRDESKLQKLIVFKSAATKQISAIANLSKKMQSLSDLWEAISAENINKFNQIVSEDVETKKLLDKYLAEFGDRFANELKLESVGIEEDAKKLLHLLKVYKNYNIQTSELSGVDFHAPLYRRILFSLVLGKFNKYASQREEFRLLRSNAFGIVRKLFRRMGSLLAKEGLITTADDVFYLYVQEILNTEPINRKSFKNLIRERKKQHVSFEKTEAPTHFSTEEGSSIQISPVKTKKERNVIQAKPCSSGLSRGKVKIFKDFSIPKKIDFDIMVASHTDPGWTSLIALTKGLIIEHGGLLSHASIVARELNIPAVIGAAGAVERLKNGQLVEIDGSTGIIKIVS